MSDPARELLEIYNLASLQQMARQDGLDPKGKNKDELINLLAPTLFDAERVRRALAALAPAERALLDELVLLGGGAPTGLLYRRLLERGVIAEANLGASWNVYRSLRGSPWNRGSNQFGDIAARLGVLGLAFSADASRGRSNDLAEPGHRMSIPPDILPLLPEPRVPVELAPDPTEVQAASPVGLHRDVYEMVRFAADAPIPLTGRGQIVKRALVRLNQDFRVPEDAAAARSEDDLGRLPLLRTLAEDLRVLEARAGTLVPGPAAESFLATPRDARLGRIFEQYRQTRRWCELFHVPDLKISASGGTGREAPEVVVRARQRVIRELGRLPADCWISRPHFVERMNRVAFDLLFTRDAVPFSPRRDTYEESVYEGNNSLGWTFQVDGDVAIWEEVEGGLIYEVIDALHWLGLLDLGLGASDGSVFRVTPAGSALLRGGTLPEAEEAPDVVVQPNFQIFAFPPTGEDVLRRLDQFAERVRADQAVEYRLTRDSVYRAQKHDVTPGAIVAFLERISRAPLPQNVRFTLDEWGEQHERIVVRRRSTILHAADAATLDDLYADAEIGPLLGRRAAPTVALVPAGQLSRVGALLLERGRLPAWEEGADGTVRAELRLDARGHVEFTQPPGIFALRALRSFAEERPDEAFELSRASLRAAARSGLTADDIVATLRRYHRGPIPPSIPEQIRSWAKDWGEGALATASLLQVETPETLAELLADPELRPHLTRLADAPTLAIVHPAAVEGVRAILIARGMTLHDRFRAL